MATSSQLSGMRGVYLVAAELAQRGFVVSLTSRSAAGADLLVTDEECRKAFSIQVKTNAKQFCFWLLSRNACGIKSDSHVYVLVNLRKNGDVEYYVLPSKYLAKNVCIDQSGKKGFETTWYSIRLEKAKKWRDKWELFAA